MTQEHLITPPLKLVKEWSSLSWIEGNQVAFAAAACWGADQELEAILTWLRVHHFDSRADALLAARRPKPPSLKELALQALYRFDDTEGHADLTLGQIEEDFVVIRRALESLPD
jgi:hypothetical protein